MVIHDDIHIGMSRVDVYKLLGGPPGNYSRYVINKDIIMEPIGTSAGNCEQWIFDTNEIVVLFDDADSVRKVFSRKLIFVSQQP